MQDNETITECVEAAAPHDVVDDVLRRIEQRGDDHAFITVVPADELHHRADELDAIRRERGGSLERLPLYGVPFAVKDNIDVAGLPTTAGCPAWSRRPASTATAVRKLLDAGALLVGKTNLDQFATGLTGTRSPYGACESVYGRRLISGGSSSGSAVAVAAGVVSFALGTDTAGSGRVPAALNGIVGLKPTRGLVSTTGVVPACASLDCVSILTRGVQDAGVVLDVIAGYDRADPWSRRHGGLGGLGGPSSSPGALRLGVPAPAELDFLGDTAMRRAFETGRDRAIGAAAGAVEIGLGPLLEAGELLYSGPWVAERLADLDEFLRRNWRDVHPVTRAVLETGRGPTAVDVFRAQHRLQELRRAAELLWDEVDLLVLPTVPTTFTIDEIEAEPITRNLALGRYTQFVNPLDLAAVTVPTADTDDGRPASLSLIGPAFSEPALLEFAARITATVTPAILIGSRQ